MRRVCRAPAPRPAQATLLRAGTLQARAAGRLRLRQPSPMLRCEMTRPAASPPTAALLLGGFASRTCPLTLAQTNSLKALLVLELLSLTLVWKLVGGDGLVLNESSYQLKLLCLVVRLQTFSVFRGWVKSANTQMWGLRCCFASNLPANKPPTQDHEDKTLLCPMRCRPAWSPSCPGGTSGPQLPALEGTGVRPMLLKSFRCLKLFVLGGGAAPK